MSPSPEGGRPPREAAARLALVLGAVAVFLLCGEVVLRALAYAPERFKSTACLVSGDEHTLLDCYPSNPRGYFDIDLRTPAARERFHSFAPRRYEVVAARAPWAVEFRYNSRGFRNAEVGPHPPGVRRVLVLGDSFTEGQGVKEADTYSRVLEKQLNAAEPGRWEVLNCGRRATDFPGLLGVFEKALAFEPDLLLYGMVLNDAARSTEFEARQTYVNDWIVDRGRMLIGRPDYAPGFFDSRLLAMIQDRWESYRIGRETARWYRDMYGEANREGWQRTQSDWLEMQTRMKARGGTMLLAAWPLLVGLDGRYPFEDIRDTVARACAALGIPYRDLLPVLSGRRAESLWVHPVDRHPNEIAHRLVAESLAPVVRRLAESE